MDYQPPDPGNGSLFTWDTAKRHPLPFLTGVITLTAIFTAMIAGVPEAGLPVGVGLIAVLLEGIYRRMEQNDELGPTFRLMLIPMVRAAVWLVVAAVLIGVLTLIKEAGGGVPM